MSSFDGGAFKPSRKGNAKSPIDPHYTVSAVRAYYEKGYKPGYLPAGFPQNLEVLRELGVPEGDAKAN
jgi:hypothetical protein